MFTDPYLPQDSRTSMDGKDPVDSNSLQPWDLPPTTQSFTAPESAEGGNGAPFPPQASPDSNGLPPCDHNVPAPSSCELKSDQNQPAAGHQQPWDIPLTTGTFSAPEPTGEEAVVNDGRVTTNDNSTSTNGVHGNIAHKKNKPEDITIVGDPAGSISSPDSVLSPHRNYGIAQPTEILLGMPQEADQDLPIKSGSHEVKVSQEEQEAVASDDKVTTTDSSTSTNGIHGNITHKKNKPEDITIVEAESDPAGSISSPASQVHSPRNYGISQPTEILLAMPQETDQDLPIKSGSYPSFEAKTSQDEPVAVEVMCHEPSSSTPLSPPPDYNTLELPPSYISDIPKVLDEQVVDDHGNSHTEQVDHDQLVAGSNTETGEMEQLQGQEVTTAVIESEVTTEVEIKPQLTENQEKAREIIVSEIRREFEEACSKGKFTEDEKYKDSCCGECMGCCFQNYSCTPSVPFRRGRNGNQSPINVSKKAPLLNTDELIKGRRQGWNDFKKAIFPLISDFLRVLWVFIELILVLVGLLFSIATLSLDQNEVFNIIHLVLAIVSCILAMIDAYETFRHSKILKKICCKKCSAEDINEEEGEDGDCKKCYSRCTDLFDVMRVILSELIFYPLLICDIFEVITGRGFEGDSSGDRLGIALFVISLISMILTVYVARIIVLVGVVIKASAIRTPKEAVKDPDLQEEIGYDPEFKKSALFYQASFCVHVVLQMLAQMLMYIAIAAKIRYDNRHFYYTRNTDQTIRFTGFLGYMIVAGYVLPFLGLLNFFIVTFYWSQQYPIGFRLDMISIFKMTEYSMCDLMNPKKMVTEKGDGMFEKATMESGKAEKLVENLAAFFVPLKNDFKELFEKGFMDKFSYPFKSPALVIICLLYALLQLAFVVCASQAMDEMGEVFTHVLNGGGWVFYYIAAIIVGAIANLYVFIVAGFWILVISAIIVAIAAAIACFIAVVVICCIASGMTSDNSR